VGSRQPSKAKPILLDGPRSGLRPEAAGREYLRGKAELLSRYKSYARDRVTRRAGWRRTLLCLYVLSTRANDLGTRGLLVGQKKPLEPKHVWSIRVRLEIARSRRELAIFNLAIDSKLRACDLVKLRIDDICSGVKVRHRGTIKEDRSTSPVRDHGAAEEFR
jgi:hypothetical protein